MVNQICILEQLKQMRLSETSQTADADLVAYKIYDRMDGGGGGGDEYYDDGDYDDEDDDDGAIYFYSDGRLNESSQNNSVQDSYRRPPQHHHRRVRNIHILWFLYIQIFKFQIVEFSFSVTHRAFRPTK